MGSQNIIVIGASAGGLAPLQTLASGLPPTLQASLFVVMHIPAATPSLLAQVLSRSGPLPAEPASDGAAIEPGRIYVAPPDHHLVLSASPERMHLRRGPRENGSRPAIDPLFRSAADAFGDRVIGIVLSGTRTDGATGLAAVESRGGMSIVQSPDEALYPGMPHAAIETTRPDFVAAASEIPQILVRLIAKESPLPVVREPSTAFHASAMSEAHATEVDPETATGVPSSFSCPDCHGVLWAIPGKAPRFRCRTGHDYSGDALVEAQSSDLESTLWAALRSAQEGADLARRLEHDAIDRGHDHSARHFAERRALAHTRVHALQTALMQTIEAPRSPKD
jgi:two-component system, chemotaxis family, protein-glutamate methylesterase/glutaminase